MSLEPIKYEVMIIMDHIGSINEKLSLLQNEGWEIAGDVSFDNTAYSNTIIPLKRVIK